MKKTLITLGAIITIFALVFALSPHGKANANPSILSFSYLNGYANQASTSVQYMTPSTASSTLIFSTLGADQVDLNILATASSSATYVDFQVLFSNGNNCDVASATPATASIPNGGVAYTNLCDWFIEDTNYLSGNFIEESTTTIHVWNPATTTTNWVGKNITETSIAAKYMQVRYWLTGANGSIWSQAAVKTQKP